MTSTLERLEIDAPVACSVTVDAFADVDDAAAALARLRGFARDGGTGWCCYPSEVVRVDGPEDLVDGAPLSAELANGQRSFSLRYVGPHYAGSIVSCSDGDTHFERTHELRAVFPGRAPGGHDVTYKTYWVASLSPIDVEKIATDKDIAVVSPVAVRFCGFSEDCK